MHTLAAVSLHARDAIVQAQTTIDPGAAALRARGWVYIIVGLFVLIAVVKVLSKNSDGNVRMAAGGFIVICIAACMVSVGGNMRAFGDAVGSVLTSIAQA